MIKEENLRFWNLEHKETLKQEENAFEIILSAMFDDKFKKKYLKEEGEELWLRVYCNSPGDYSYLFGGENENIVELELNQDEKMLLNLYILETNLVLDESERLGIELDENDKYHWGIS